MSSKQQTNRKSEEMKHTTLSVDELHKKSRGGLWGILFYLVASIIAYHFRDLSLASVVSAETMQMLGPVPPLFMANIVLWISTCSALVIISGRLYHSTEPSSTISHLGFRIGFYILFFVVGGLGQAINVLFISGLVVMALQHYNVFHYFSNAIENDFTAYSRLQKNNM